MSLGLDDLKKRTPAAKVTEDWARATKTARPWTTSELTKTPKTSRKANSAGAHMNSEWAGDHTATLHAFDMEVPSALTQLRDLQISLKEQAVEIERKIKRAAKSPFEIAKSVLRMVQK